MCTRVSDGKMLYILVMQNSTVQKIRLTQTKMKNRIVHGSDFFICKNIIVNKDLILVKFPAKLERVYQQKRIFL